MSEQEMFTLFTDKLAECLGQPFARVELHKLFTADGPNVELVISAGDKIRHWIINGLTFGHECFESDKRGLDAMGIFGSLATGIWMLAALQSGMLPERMPPVHSGLKLSRHGESYCAMIADEWKRYCRIGALKTIAEIQNVQTKPPAEPSRSAGDHMGHEPD